MPDNEQIDRLIIELEQRGFSDVAKAFKNISAETENTKHQARQLADAYKQAGIEGANAGKRAASAVDAASKAVERARDRADDFKDELEDAADAADAMAGAINRAAQAQESFDTVSRSVALAGDVQSNLGALRGIAGIAGLGGVGGGIGAVGEIVALAEELPRLKAAVAGLPSVVSNAVSVLGVGGVGLIGGLAALTVVFGEIQKESEKAAQAVRDQIQAQQDYNALVQTGTTENLQRKLQTDLDAYAIAEKNLEVAQQAYAQKLGHVLDEIPTVLLPAAQLAQTLNFGPLANEVNAASDAVDEAQRAFDAANRAIYDTKRAMDEQQVALNDLAAQEARLREERRKSVDAMVNNEIAVLTRAQSLNTEQANARIKAIDDEIAAIERYKNTAGQSDENIAANEARLTQLRQEKDLIGDLLPTLIARNDALAYEKQQLEETAAATQKYIDDIQRIEEQSAAERIRINEAYSDKIISIAQKAADAADKALEKLEDRRASLAQALSEAGDDAELERQRDELDLQIKFQREEAKALRAHEATLKSIREKANQDAKGAVQDRNVVALDQIRREEKQALESEVKKFEAQEKERKIAYRDELADQARQFERERQDRLAKYQRDLKDAQDQYNKELAAAAKARNEQLVQAKIEYDKQLAAEKAKHDEELALRKTAAQAELNMIALTEKQRFDIIAATQKALIDYARSLSAGGIGNPIPGAAPVKGPQGGGGSQIFSTAPIARGGGGANFTFAPVINGGGRQQIQRQVARELETFLNSAGIPR